MINVLMQPSSLKSIFVFKAFYSNFTPTTKMFIDGKFMESKTTDWSEIRNPATNEIVSKVPNSTKHEMNLAIHSCTESFHKWSSTSFMKRQQYLLKLHDLVKRDAKKLAEIITVEQGKTLNNSMAEVILGLRQLAFACAIPNIMFGETMPSIADDTDCVSYREPLGITAAVLPYNFPFMIPAAVISASIMCGNTMLVKPSTRVPGATLMLMDLCCEAGIPPGVINVIHGRHELVDFICTHPDVKAVTFLGGDDAGKLIYNTGSTNGKRVQSHTNAKNHGVVMPDAEKEDTIDKLIFGAFESAGQLCLALSTAVFVGDTKQWIPELVKCAKLLKVSAGHVEGVDVGPVISKESKERICRLIESGVAQGAKIALDGRNIKVPGYENGHFIGPTILTDVRIDMDCYKEEIFGPVLICLEVDTLEEAITMVNQNQYGNSASIFTKSGSNARQFTHSVNTGMVGVNVPVALPIPFFSLTGSKGSFFGDLHVQGKEIVQFYTQQKTVTQFWRKDNKNQGK